MVDSNGDEDMLHHEFVLGSDLTAVSFGKSDFTQSSHNEIEKGPTLDT